MEVEANKHAFHKMQKILGDFQKILDQKGLINLTIDGRVQFITPRAEQLLKQYSLLGESNSLSDPIHQWCKQQISQLSFYRGAQSSCLPFRIEQTGQQLIIQFVSDPSRERYFLLLEEQKLSSFSVTTLEQLGLTKREAEVLFWIAKDKSNAGIAKALGCCEGTVRKHLENVYKKLGVQTRMGAVMVALEQLGLLKRE